MLSKNHADEELEEVYRSFLKKNSSPLRKKLMEAMKARGITPDDLVELTGLSWNNLFNDEGGFPKSEKDSRPLKIERFALLYLILQFNPEEFMLDVEVENSFLERENKRLFDRQKGNKKGGIKSRPTRPIERAYFVKKYWEEIQRLWPDNESKIWEDIDLFIHHNPSHHTELIEAYTKVAPYFANAKHSITVHELLLKGRFKETKTAPAHEDAQTEVHSAIVQALEKQKQSEVSQNDIAFYERIFYLSGSSRLFLKSNPQLWLDAFVSEASLATLQHICFCLENYGSLCKFSVVGHQYSLRHRAIIDDKILIIEDYKYKADIVSPESLCLINLEEKEQGRAVLSHLEKMRQSLAEEKEIWSTTQILEHLNSAELHCDVEAKCRKELLQIIRGAEMSKSSDNGNIKGNGNDPYFRNLLSRLEDSQNKFKEQADDLGKKMAQLR